MRKVLSLLSKQGLIRKIWFGFPEGRLKDRLRRLGLRFCRTVPFELTLRKGDTAVQIGATSELENGEGGETLIMAQIVGRNGRVIVIEPDMKNLEGLRKNLEEKLLKNVTLVPKGAWNEKGKQRLLLSPHPQQHRIDIPEVLHGNDLRPENYQYSIEIEVDTLDNILESLGTGKVDYVKITVNGAELQVLKGMKETLKQDLRLLVKGHAIKDGQPIDRAIASFLENKGFVTQIIEWPTTEVSEDFPWGGEVYAERRK